MDNQFNNLKPFWAILSHVTALVDAMDSEPIKIQYTPSEQAVEVYQTTNWITHDCFDGVCTHME